MNFVGKFDFSHIGDQAGSSASVDFDHHLIGDRPFDGSPHTIIVPDPYLLFSGDYKRSGLDLVLSKDGHDHIVHDYFRGHSRATLAAPDGAFVSGDLVTALVGEVQVAQAGGGSSVATVIGRVTKLTGNATAIRNGVSIQLNMGDAVNKGDVVQAGSDSSLGLTFIDGTVFGLSANARMVLNEMVYDPNGSSNSSLLSLVQGTITFVAGETAKHGDMKVDTPVATMGIRGTAVLVEIDIGNAKFQVLAEPDGHVGSYVLIDRSGAEVATINQAGQVTSYSTNGLVSVAQDNQLAPEAAAIIQQTLQLYFPSYVPAPPPLAPNPNPQGTSTSSSGSGTPVSGASDPTFAQSTNTPPPQIPVGVPTTVQLPPIGNAAPVTVTITRFNSSPTIVVTPVVNATSFDIPAHVTIADPDATDIAIPYVPGTGRILGAVGPANIPAGTNLAALVTIDPATGHVSYNPANFIFLAQGQSVVVTVGFDSQSGPDTFHETLAYTIDGVNDAPIVASALSATIARGSTPFTANLLTGATDPDDGETATLAVTGVTYKFGNGTPSATPPAGVTLNGTTLSVDPRDAAFSHLALGQTTTIVVSYNVTDIHGATVVQTETITIIGANEAPVVTAALTSSAAAGATPLTLNMLSGASDPDDGETATLTISGVHYVVNGGTSLTAPPAGISLTGNTLSVDPGNAAFNHLAAGQSTTIVVSYNVTDVHGASVPQTETVTITGTNDAPVVTATLTSAAAEGAAAFTANLLSGASDPDDGETATLTISGVHYVVNGGTSVTTPPAGISLNGSTLSVDPSNAAFNHLAAGQSTTIVVSYNVTDVHGASVPQTETLTITGTNAAPVVASALTSTAAEGAAAFTANLLSGASDPDDGETATLTISGVHYVVNGGTSLTAPPAGISLTGNTLSVDPGNAAFNHLAAGQSTTIVVSYNVTDVHGASVPQTETITVTGTNDAPALASGTIAANTVTSFLSGTPGNTVTPGAAAVLNAGPGLISGLGGQSGYGPNTLAVGDDNSSGPIDITGVFGSNGLNFFGHSYTSLYINNNGNITFGGPLSTFTPSSIAGALNNPIIAAFWADVDTRGSGSGRVYYDLDSVDGVMTITWDHVGYYSGHTDLLNTFQIVLVSEGGGNFDIVYRYGDIEWTTGDVSGGLAARAGYSANNSVDYYELPQSGNAQALRNLPTAPIPTFSVQNGAVAPATVSSSGVINFADVDLNDVHTASATSVAGTVGSLTLTRVHDTIGSGTAGQFTWTYNASNVDVQNALIHSADGTAIETFNVVIDDGHAGTVTQTVSVTLTASNANVWSGQSSSLDLSSAAGWSLGHIPTTTEFVYIDTGSHFDLHLSGQTETIGGLHLVTDAEIDLAAVANATAFTVAGPLVNAGTIAIGQNATLHVTGFTENTGSLKVQGGTIKIDGAVTGHGQAVINGGTMEFGDASDAHVQFTGMTHDTLILDDVAHFTGTLSGLSIIDGDTVRLGSIAASTAVTQSDPSVLQFNFSTGNINALIAANYAENGGANTHSLVATANNDILIGGNGADNFVFRDSSGQHTITNFTFGQDHIDLSAIVNTNDFNAWFAAHVTTSPTNSNDTLITINDHDTITLHGVQHSNLQVSDFIVHA